MAILIPAAKNARGLLLAVFLSLPLAALAETRPNILFLLADDMRWDAMGHRGNAVIETPEMDKLAAGGVSFTHSYVTTSICMVSRATIFTGQYMSGHGIDDFATPLSPEQFAKTYPMLMRGAGYHTGFIGKWGLGGDLPVDSFDYFEGFSGQGWFYQPEDKEEKGPHLTQIMGGQAAEFLKGVPAGKPFALSVSFKAPHVQDQDPRQFIPDHALAHYYEDKTVPPPSKGEPEYFASLPEFLQTTFCRVRWEKRFATEEMYQTSVKNYYRLVTGIDIVIGQIREQLADLGLAENTVIVFASDNGMYLGEMGFAGKWLMHEESIRTPLIVLDPRLPRDRRGAATDAMALNIDMAPTLLELAGIAPPDAVQGRSLVPLIQGKSIPWRSEWYYEHHYIRDQVPGIPATEGVHNGTWKYILYPDSEPRFEELYNLEKDPRERVNLARDPAHSATLEELRTRHALWREAVKKTGADWQEPS